MTTGDDVREVALALPESSERLTWGTPGYRVRKKLFARIWDEPDVLVLWRESPEERDALIETEPDKFFKSGHYEGYPMVLVRLGAVDREELTDLLVESWFLNAPKRLAAEYEGRLPE